MIKKYCIILLLAAASTVTNVSCSTMSRTGEGMHSNLIGKTMQEITALYGEPNEKTFTDSTLPPQHATEAERQKFLEETANVTWEYSDRYITFNCLDRVMAVTE